MKKFRLYVNLDEEEKWLNEMSNKGWELRGKEIKYKFGKTSTNDTIIKIDYRTFKSKGDFQNYITLFQDSGWAHIAGTKTSGKQYFKKINETAGSDIFSDTASKAARYKQMSYMWLSLVMVYIPVIISLIMAKAVDINALFNPQVLYYTPGLWEKTGASFWGAFLFETPFAICRGFSGWFVILAVILYAVFAVKAQRYYRKTAFKK